MNEFLEFLKKFAGTLSTEEVSQVATALRTTAATQAVFQAVYDQGHAKALAEGKSTARTLQGQIDSKQAELEALKTEFDEFKAKTPDVKAVEDRYKPEITRLTTEIKELKKAHRKERVDWHVERAAKDFAAELVKLGVDPEWAEYLAGKPENRARFRPVVEGEEDGVTKITVEVLKAGTEVPLQAEKPLEAFAAEVRKDIKPQYITSNADHGTGERKGGTGGKGNIYDNARDDQKKMTGSGIERPEGFKTGAERLGAI